MQTPPEMRAEKTVSVIRDLKDTLHKMTRLPRTLSEAGVEKDSLGKIAQKALKDPAINFNPVAVGYEDVERILQKAF